VLKSSSWIRDIGLVYTKVRSGQGIHSTRLSLHCRYPALVSYVLRLGSIQILILFIYMILFALFVDYNESRSEPNPNIKGKRSFVPKI